MDLNLIATIAGIIIAFIVGIVAEPIKGYFENKRDITRLRIALYREIARTYRLLLINFVFNKNDDDLKYESLSWLLSDECYKYARANPILFYQLKDSAVIDDFYIFLSKAKTNLVKSQHRLDNINTIVYFLEHNIKNDYLDKRAILKLIPEVDRERVKARLK